MNLNQAVKILVFGKSDPLKKIILGSESVPVHFVETSDHNSFKDQGYKADIIIVNEAWSETTQKLILSITNVPIFLNAKLQDSNTLKEIKAYAKKNGLRINFIDFNEDLAKYFARFIRHFCVSSDFQNSFTDLFSPGETVQDQVFSSKISNLVEAGVRVDYISELVRPTSLPDTYFALSSFLQCTLQFLDSFVEKRKAISSLYLTQFKNGDWLLCLQKNLDTQITPGDFKKNLSILIKNSLCSQVTLRFAKNITIILSPKTIEVGMLFDSNKELSFPFGFDDALESKVFIPALTRNEPAELGKKSILLTQNFYKKIKFITFPKQAKAVASDEDTVKSKILKLVGSSTNTAEHSNRQGSSKMMGVLSFDGMSNKDLALYLKGNKSKRGGEAHASKIIDSVLMNLDSVTDTESKLILIEIITRFLKENEDGLVTSKKAGGRG